MVTQRSRTSSISAERLRSLVRTLSGGRRGAAQGAVRHPFDQRRRLDTRVKKLPGVDDILCKDGTARVALAFLDRRFPTPSRLYRTEHCK